MIRGLEGVLISSEDPKALADFYKEKVGLESGEEFEYGEEKAVGYMLKLGDMEIGILSHSDIKGKNQSPARIMLNIEVDDEEAEVKRLKEAGVKVVADIYHVEGYGLIATFEDPDGNYFQFVQIRAS